MTLKRDLIQVGILGLGITLLALVLSYSNNSELFLYASILAVTAVLSTLVAYRKPLFTITLTIFLGQMIDRDIARLEFISFPSFSGILLRYFDPILLGILLAILIKFILADSRVKQLLGSWIFILIALLAWILIITAQSSFTYGLKASLGELRTVYQYVLMLPYVILFFNTKQKQWQLFKLLLIAGSLFGLIALWQATFIYDFKIVRWFKASSNFALLTSLIGTIIASRYKSVKLPFAILELFVLMFLFLTLVSTHRSVWLASIVAVLCLLFFRVLSLKRLVIITILSSFAFLGALVLYQQDDKNLSFITYLEQRVQAFTNYEWLDEYKDGTIYTKRKQVKLKEQEVDSIPFNERH